MARSPKRRSTGLARDRRRRDARHRRLVAVAKGHHDLALEQLETRQLLAITVTDQNLAQYRVGADYVFTDPTSIVVSPGVVIDAAGGAITMTAPSITINDGAKLLSKGTGGVADGAITLKAEDTQPYLSSTTGDWLRNFLGSKRGGTVSLGKNVAVDGGAFTVLVRSGDDVTRLETISSAFDSVPLGLGVVPDAIFGSAGSVIGTNELLASPVSWIVKQPTSTIDIGENTSIASSGDVSIKGWSSAWAWIHASWMLLSKATNAGGGALGVAYSDAKATATVGKGVQIVSAGSVDVRTDVFSYTNARANTGLNTGIGTTNPESVGVAAALTIQNSTSTIHLKPESLVRAARQVRINAFDDEQMWGEAYVASYKDGSVGIVGSAALSNSDVRVTVEGTIEAGSVVTPAALEFNPAYRVDFTTSTIRLPSDVTYVTGDEVVYSSNGGGSIPGLRSGGTYYAIVDPANKKAVRLATTKADAVAGKAIVFGAGFPTLTGAGTRGTLPIVAVKPADDTIDFEFDGWADGTKFSAGETVTYTPAAGQYLGFKKTDGSLAGPLEAGTYTIGIVFDPSALAGTRLRLLKNGTRVDLDTSPVFTTAGGTSLRVKSFDLVEGTVAFSDAAALTNGAPLTYVQAVAQKVPGLVNGCTYYAIVDPATPGLIRLAATARQAQAANPAVQGRNPGLEFTVPATQTQPETTKTLVPVRLDPGTGLIFDANPNLTDGQAVSYRAVPGRPVAGLVDGTTYYAYNQPNPDFKADWPEYIVGLRAAADASLPLVEFWFSQSLESGGATYDIGGVDARRGTLTLDLTTPVKATAAGATGLGGGSVVIRDIPADSAIVWTTASGGTWRMKVPTATGSIPSAALPATATAAQVRNALNTLGVYGVRVTEAFGRGTADAPWVLIGENLAGIEFDSTALIGGSAVGRMTEAGLQAISTTAATGTFTLTLDVAGTPATTGPIAAGATAAAVSQALAAVAGVSPWVQAGAGTAANPWLVSAWHQPLVTGDSAVFRDGFGSETVGILDGQTYYLVVQPSSPPGTLVVRLAATAADATAATPVTLDLTTSVLLGDAFGRPTAEMLPLSGTRHTLASTLEGSIVIRAEGTFGDGQSACVQTGGYPSLFDLLSTRKDLILGGLVPNLRNYASGIVTTWKGTSGTGFWGNVKKLFAVAAGQVSGNMLNLDANGTTLQDSVGRAGSFSFLKATRSVQTIIGSTATLVSSGKIVVDSRLEEGFQSEATSGVSKPDSARKAVAIAVNVALANTTCQTIVHSGAKITGGDGVFLDAKVTYPWFFQSIRDRFGAMTSWTDVFYALFTSITVDLNNKFGTHQARSSTDLSTDAAGKNARIGKALAGGVSVVNVTNRCETIVEDGVEINQLDTINGVPLVVGTVQPVSVTASTEMLQLGYASGWNADWLASDSSSLGNLDGQSADAKTGLGFSVGYYGLANTTRAVIGGSAPLAANESPRTPSGPTKVGFGDGGLTVDATNWGLLLQFGMGGTTSSNFAFSGSAAVIDAARSPQRVEAAILPNATHAPVIRRRGTTAGDVRVAADDVSYLIPIAGALNRGAANMVGVSTAIALTDRDVIARIGDEKADAAAGGVVLTTAGDVSVDAKAAGAITPSAVAGAKKSAQNAFEGEGEFVFDERTETEVQRIFTGENALTVDRFGIGASGAVAVAKVDDTVTATVNHSGTMTAAAAAALTVSATNTSTILANTGGLAIVTAAGEEKVSAGLSGAVSVIVAASNVEASVRRATIDSFSIDVAARNARSIGTAAASGAGGAVGGAGSVTVTFAGSVAINSLTTRTIATLDRVTGTSLANARVVATTDDLVWTVAGSFVGNVSTLQIRKQYQLGGSVSAADNGRSLAAGASVAVINADTTTRAEVDASNLTFAQGTLDVLATESSTVITASGGGSFVSTGGTATALYSTGNKAGSSVCGFVAVANVDPTVEATITDSTVTMGDAGGDVSVLATTAMLLVTASGGFVLNRDGNGTLSTSIGAAVTVVNSTARGTAKVERSRIAVPKGKVRVRSTNGNPDDGAWDALDPVIDGLNMPEAGSGAVWSFAIGAVASDSSLTVAASVNVTNLEILQTATITDDSTVTVTAGSVEVTALNEAKIRTVAGSIATTAFTSGNKSTLSAGAAVLVTSMGGATTASIASSSVTAGTDATVETSGRVVVAAADKADILTIAASGVMSGKNAISTALVFNDFTGRSVSAKITGTTSKRSAVSASKSVTVLASEETNLTAVAGQVAIPASTSAGAAGGAAGSENYLEVDVTAAIENATVTSTGGTVTVQTVTGGTLNAWSVGVSGALSVGSGGGILGSGISFAGAGSFAANYVTRRSIAAVRDKASVTARALTVDAEDSAGIFAVAGALAGQVGSKVSLAAGISVAINEIGTEASRGFVKAMIENATVTLSGGDLTVAAESKGRIESSTIAGAGAVAKASGAGWGVAGAGAVNLNSTYVDTQALVTQTATVTTTGKADVKAIDTSTISSLAGGAGLGLSLSSEKATTVTVGAASGTNTVTNRVRAAVESATLSAGGDASITATSKQAIDSDAFGVAIAAAATGGAVSVSAAGSGAGAYNNVTTSTEAEILSATVKAGTAGSGGVTLAAVDAPTIDSTAGAGSLAVSISAKVGFGVAFGLVIAQNTLANTVAARIGTAEASSRLPDVTAAGAVSLNADSAADITSYALTVSASVTVSLVPVAVAGAATVASDTVTNTITAEIASGTVRGTSVDVSANAKHAITSKVQSAAVTVSGASLAVGVSEVTGTVNDTILAQIGKATVTATTGGITVAAGAASTVDVHAQALALAYGLGGAGTGSPATARDTSTVTATVGSTAVLSATKGSLAMLVGGSADGGQGQVTARADGISGGVAAVGAALATAEHAQTRLVSVGDGVLLGNVAGLTIDAQAAPSVQANSFAVDTGGIAVSVNRSKATVSGSVKATTGAGVVLPGTVAIKAAATSAFDVSQIGGQGSVVGFGSNSAQAFSKLTVEAALGNGAIAAGDRVESLTITATHADTSAVKAAGGMGAVAGIAIVSSELTDETKTLVSIGKAAASSPLKVGTLTALADRSQRYDVTADSAFGGGWVGGVPATTVESEASAVVDVAADADIVATGTVSLRTANSVTRTTEGLSARVVGGGVISHAGNEKIGSTTTVTTESLVKLGSGSSIVSGTGLSAPSLISILPTSTLNVRDSAGTYSGGVAAFGGQSSKTTATTTTAVEAASDVVLSSRGTLEIGTAANVAATNSVDGTAGGLGASVTFWADTDVTVTQRVRFGTNARLSAGTEMRITPGGDPAGGAATSVLVDAKVDGYVGGAATWIDVMANAALVASSDLSFGSGSVVGSGGSMRLVAEKARPVVTNEGVVRYKDASNLFGLWEGKKEDTSAPSQTITATVDLAGTFTAGNQSDVTLAIPAGFTAGTLTGTPAENLGLPVTATFDGSFDPHAFIDGEFSEDAAGLLTSKVPGTGRAVRISPLVASGGSLVIGGDTLRGTATLVANAAQITVTNESANHLVFDTLAIPGRPAGSISIRDSAGATINAPAGWSRTDDPAGNSIRIEQKAGPLDSSGQGPAVFLAEKVTNTSGTVTITNSNGSFGALDTVSAKTLDVNVHGVAVFSVKGATHAGGPPPEQVTVGSVTPREAERVWYDNFSVEQQGYTRTFDTTLAPAQTTVINARQVAIVADTINVNGDMLVGTVATPNQSVVVPLALESELRTYQADYAAGRQTARLYRIPFTKLEKKAGGDAPIGVMFDAQTGQLIVDEADLGAGTRLTLVGKIINTSASAGAIKVNTAGGEVTIDNKTSFPLVTQAISTPGTGNSTTVRIVDMLRPEATRQAIYRSVGGELLVYVGAATADLLAGEPTTRLTGATTSTYQPLANARWEWTRTGSWAPEAANEWTYGATEAFGVTSDNTAGRVVIRPGAAFEQQFKQSTGGGPFITLTESVRGDFPIGLSFTGSATAGVSITSAGAVHLRDSIASRSVTINALGGAIDAIPGIDGITADSVTLLATGSIGHAEQALEIAAAALSVQSGGGDIFLAVNRATPEQAVTLGRVGAFKGGTVSLTAGGDIRAAAVDPSRLVDFTVLAGKAVLVSQQGSIGTAADPVRTRVSPLDTPAATSLRLDASAAANVHVSHLDGDLLVGTVTATAGDVSITTAGSLYDAHTWTVNPNRAAEIDRALEDLGIRDTDAAIAKAVAAFRATVKSHYLRYWALKTDGVFFNGRLQLRTDAYDTWSFRTAAALKLPAGAKPTVQQVLDHAAGTFTASQDFFARTVGATWASLAPFTTFDADWTYTLSPVQLDQVKADLGLDSLSLLRQVGVDMAEATRPWDPAVRIGGTVNVTGANVTLVSTTGTVGRFGEPVTISADDVLNDRLTAAQTLEMELAGRRGDAVKVTGGFQFRVLRPLVVAVGSGKLDAAGRRGVAIAQPTGTLRIGRIAAVEGTVDLAAAATIENAAGGTGMSTKPLAGMPPIPTVTATLFSRTGSIGSADSPIAVDGGIVTAGVLASGAAAHISSPYAVLTEDPPRPQPNAPGEPQVPLKQDVARVDLQPDDVTTFALGGTAPGDGAGKHDQTVVAGQAVLDGTVVVQLATGYVPQAGDRFTIMTYQSVVGRFTAGRGLFGLAGDLWFEVEQTGNATAAGSITLVAREFLPGIGAALNVADSLGVDAASIRDDIGEFLNRDYFGIDIQVTFSGGFVYGDLAIQGAVTLRHDPNPTRADFYEASVTGTATVGDALDLAGEFLVSVGVRSGTATSLALLAEDVNLEVAIGGATLGATSGRIGLLASAAGVAFEASAGVYANLASDLSLSADEVFVSYNGTSVDYTGVMFALGDVSYTFDDLAAGTFAIGVSGGELVAGGFLRAAGSFAITGRSQEVTLAGGTKVTADVLTIGGVDLGGFAGSNAGTRAAAGISITGVDVAAALVTERVAAGKTARRWVTVEGGGTSASLVGVSGVTGSLTSTALSLNLAAADGSVIDYAAGKTVLTVATGGSGISLSADGSKGRIIRASGTASLAVEGSLSVSGTVGISLEGSNVVAVGTGISATLGAADASTFLKVTNGSFGLISTGTETAFELTGGLSAALAGFASVSADRVVAQYTSAETSITKGRKLDTGTAAYTFAQDIAKGTTLFALVGFTANVSDFVTLAGDVGFKSDGSGFTAVGRTMTATLAGGTVASLSASGGSFGLSIAGGETAFELSAKSFQFQIGGLPRAAADTVFFRYTSANKAVSQSDTLSVGGVSYTFAEPIAKDTIAFSFSGFETAISEVLSVSGAVGFAKAGSDLIGLGSDIDVSLRAGGIASVTATDGAFGLVVNGSGVAFELQGGFSATIAGVFGASAERTVVQYASNGVSIAAGRRLAIGAADYTFAKAIAANTVAFSVAGFSANVSGFVPLSGNLGFAVVAGELIAVGSTMSAGSMNDRYGGLRATGGRFGLVASPEGTAFELGDGSFEVRIADLTDVSSGSTFVQFSTAGLTLAAGRKITAGGLDYTFTKGIAPGTNAFAVSGFAATVKDFVSLAGDVGFSIVDGMIVAVADSVVATLAAGDYASLSVGGRFGLRASGDQVAIEVTGNDLSASITGLARVKADSVFVQFTTPTMSVAKNEVLRVGQASYTFAKPITAGTVAFDVKGISADLFGVVTVSGDIGFAYKPAELLLAARATDFSAAFTLGDQIEASVSHATFDIRVGSQMLFALQGEAQLKAFGLIDETVSVRIQPDYRRLTLDDGSQIDGAVLSFAAKLPDLFFGKDGPPADRIGIGLEDASFGFAVATDLGSNRFWVAAEASSAFAGFVGIDDFTATATDAGVVINTNTVIGGGGRSIDWSKTPYTLTPVLLGDATAAGPITLDMKGQSLAARGTVHANLLGIAAIDGRFSFESSRRTVALVGGATADVDALTLGIHDGSAFIGTTNSGVRKGLAASDVDLAFGVFRERSPAVGATARQWSLLDANVGRFDLTGIDGVTISATNVEMGYIHLPADGSSIDTSKPIAYDGNLSFSLGADRVRPGASSLFSFAGDFDVDVKGLVQFQDSIDIQVELDTLRIYDPVAKTHSSEDVATITFAALDRTVFAGDESNGKRVGLELSGVDIAAAVAFGPQTGSIWVAVDASATGTRTVGLDRVSLTTEHVALRINTPDYRGHVIDFKARPLEVPTGLAIKAGNQGGSIWGAGQSAMLALDGTTGDEAGVLEIADATLSVADFLYARGDYAFRIGQHTSGLVVNGLQTGGGSTRLTDRFAVLSLAATDMDVFVGYRGADIAGTTSPFTSSGIRDGAVGLYAHDIDLGYAVFTDGLHVFDALKLDLPSASFVGLGDTVTATLEDVTVGRNGGVRVLDARLAAIDFQQTFGLGGYTLTTPGGSVVLDAANAVQAVSAEVAKAVLKVDGFLDLSGSLTFKAGGQIFGAKADAGLLKAIPGVSVTGLTHDLYTIEVGGTHLKGFAGATVAGAEGEPAKRVGVVIDDVSFGLAIMASMSVSGITVPGIAAVLPVYIAAKAKVGTASIVGADEVITATAKDTSIEVNTSYLPVATAVAALQAVLPMPTLDLQGTAFADGGAGLEIATGDAAQPILLDFRKEVVAAEVAYFDGDLAGSVQVAGSLAFAKRGGEKATLTNGREISVTSLGFSMSDVRAFLGTGRYWGRNPATGRIDGTVTDPSAAGFVVDDLDLGGVFMLDTSLSDPGIYAAVHASLPNARVVGVEGFTARVQTLFLDMNVGLNRVSSVVDFSRSTHGVVDQSGTITTEPGYAIAGPRGATPVVLTYDQALVRIQGMADFNLLDVAVGEGRLDIQVDAAGLVLYVDGSGRLGTADGFRIEVSQFQTFLRVNAGGMAAKATVTVPPIVLGAAVSLTTDTLTLSINTTGKDVSYTIPETIRRPGKPDAITVSAIPPGGTQAAGYAAASGAGRLRIFDTVSLTGSFDILLKSDVSTLAFDMTLDVPVLNPLMVMGSLQYVSGTSGGLFGSLGVGAANGASVIDVAGFSLNAAMLLEVNTSPIERQVRSIRRSGESDPDGDGYVLRAVTARSTRIAGTGQLVAGPVTLDGAVSLTFDPGRIRASLISEVDVGFGYAGVSGQAEILYGEGRDTVFALDGRISGTAGGVAGIDGTVQINTGAADVTLDGGTVVKARTDFDARIAARIDVGLFTIDVGGRMFRQNDLFEIRVDQGTASFFNVATLSVTGFYRSNGAFLLDARTSFSFSLADVTVSSSLAMSLGRDATGAKTFSGRLDGQTRYDGWLGTAKGPGFTAGLVFGPSSVSFSSRVSILGVSFPLSAEWKRTGASGSNRPDPVIARLADGVLTLSAGDDPLRYDDPNGDWYGSIVNESFTIDAVRDAAGTPIAGRVRVRALGVEREFSGVARIVAYGGDGNDIFEVGPGIDALLQLAGGAGSDTFLIANLTAGSTVNGGDGVGYDILGITSRFMDNVLANDVFTGPTLAPAATPDRQVSIPGIDGVRFSDRTVALNWDSGLGSNLDSAPSSVSFTGRSTVIAEDASTATRIRVADIEVGDDGFGTNVLGVAGDDADLFEIDGVSLYLRAGSALDWSAKPLLRVTVQAADPAVIGADPVSADLVVMITKAGVRTNVSVQSGVSVDTGGRTGALTLVKQGGGTLVLDAPNAHSGGTDVESGEVVVGNALALGEGGLRVRGTATVTFTTGGDPVELDSLVIDDGGRIDLGYGRISIAPGRFDAETIREQIAAGRGEGSWDGNGGITTARSLGDGEPGRGIGWMIDADGSLVVAYAASGDTNLDGIVDLLDTVTVLTAGLFDTAETATWTSGDFNYDGMVDLLDVMELLATGLFNAGGYLPATAPATTAEPVSEMAVIETDAVAPSALQSAFAWIGTQGDASTPPNTATSKPRRIATGL